MQDLLERLENWLKKHRPDYASRLQPGLSSEEIAEIAAPLPFQLADEVIDLYHWHNGTLNLHGGFDDEFFQPIYVYELEQMAFVQDAWH